MARFNGNKYFVFNMPNDNWARNNGFQPAKSTDGQWFIGDRGSNRADIASSKKPVSLPVYATPSIVDFYEENGYLDHKNARKLVTITASSEGASDGFTAPGDD